MRGRGKRQRVGDKRHIEAAGSTFAPDELDLVRMIALRGSSDAEMAEFFGVAPAVWHAWQQRYPSFAKAIEAGRTRADANVLAALYQRCVGYNYEEQQAVGGRDPEVLEVKRHAPPSVDGIKLWMTNRQREYWRSRESLEHSTPDGPIGVKVASRDELIDAIVGLVASKPDGVTKPGKTGKN